MTKKFIFALLLMPALAWAQSADLVANNAGPSTSSAGVAFSYVLRLSNNGPGAADGATFTDTMPSNATNVAATCTGATGGAVCPTGGNLVFTNAQVSGSLPVFPNQALVEITITGNYGQPSPTSVTSIATIRPPAGVTETNNVTNTSTVNTTMVNTAKVVVSKTLATENGVPTYTITVNNEGLASANGAAIVDELLALGASAAGQAQVQANFLSCIPAANAECPANAAFFNFNGTLTGGGTQTRALIPSGVIPRLPPGSGITIKYQVAITASATCGLTAATLTNRAEIRMPTGVTNTATANTSTATMNIPATAACAPFPVGVTKTQSRPNGTILANGATIAYGDTIRYTVTAVNNGTAPDDGTVLRDWINNPLGGAARYAGLQASLVSCVAASGAVCPDDASFPVVTRSPNGDTSGDLFSVAIPTFPAGGRITVTYDVVLTAGSWCGIAAGLLNNYASVSPRVDGRTPLQVGPVTVNVPATPACPNVQLTKTASTQTPQAGVPFDYVVTLTNSGPGAADGAIWQDSMRGSNTPVGLSGQVQYVSCDATNGAECPAAGQFLSHASASLTGTATTQLIPTAGTPIPRLPAGGVITLRYRVTLAQLPATSGCLAAGGFIENSTSVKLTPLLTRSANVRQRIICSDVGITKTVDPVFARAGEPLVYTVTVSNAGMDAAPNVLLSDPLPSIFMYESATCEVTRPTTPTTPVQPATACGLSVDYDAVAHKLTSTITNLGMLGEVRFTIRGRAGSVPGTYKNEAFAIVPPGVFDPILTTNRTDVNVQIDNTQSPVTVSKRVDGLPVTGLPVSMTFTGTVACGVQPAQNWSITVPAGASSGNSTALIFYDSEVCTVTEDMPPTAPTGYSWEGAPIIVNTPYPLGPSAPRSVSVTNTLKRQTIGLTLTKRFSGPSEGLSKVNGDFNFAIDCGIDGKFNALVRVMDGTTGTATVSDLPTGAICTVTELPGTSAPSGYIWDAPTYTTNPLVVPEAGTAAEFTVTNTLKGGDIKPVPGLRMLCLFLLCGCLAALGMRVRR